jgi:hypothetical protein
MTRPQTQADKQALEAIHIRALVRELGRRPPKYDTWPKEQWTLQVGADCVWLWHATDWYESTPVRAIVLQIKGDKVQIRAEFVAGPAIIWVDVDWLRPPKRRST